PWVRLVRLPQPVRPWPPDGGADQRPVLVLDLIVALRAHARGRDGARVPADGGIRLRLLERRQPYLRELLATRLERRPPAVVDQPFHLLDQHRQARLGVTRNGEIDFLVAPEVLIVGLQ